MSSPGQPHHLVSEADPRMPFPHSVTPTACRSNYALFAHNHGDSVEDTDGRIAQANAACRVCTLAADCLKWALANPQLTPNGIWAATTPRQRTTLRQRLVARLGRDWVAVVAEHDRRRSEAHRQRVPAVRAQSGRRASHKNP
ncbi:WhiB family transcriptional regulator [Actinacidiphila glaucinigra]|uniref:WhiB family transcriptional regulator n=1 Tax=Actinacidiphila glaucinigra TaxID=235986 RepID=UPI003248FC01